MGSFQVTPEYLTSAAAACQSTADQIQEELSSLQTYITNLEDWWQGIASTTFQELMVKYQTCSKMLHDALTDIGSGLSGNYVNYADNEQANITTLNSIDSSLSTANLS